MGVRRELLDDLVPGVLQHHLTYEFDQRSAIAMGEVLRRNGCHSVLGVELLHVLLDNLVPLLVIIDFHTIRVTQQQQRAATNGGQEEETSTYGRALVKELKDKVSGLEKKLSRREAELRDAGESAKRARLEHAMLAGEMRRDDRIMGFSSEKESNWYEVRKVSASPLKKNFP